MITNIFLIPLLALSMGWESRDVEFTWTPRGDEYEYIVEIYTDREFTQIYVVSEPVKIYKAVINFKDTDLYFVKVIYYIPNTDIYGYEYWGQIYINLEHEYVGESDEVWFPEQEEQPPTQPPLIQEEQEIVVEREDIYSLPPNLDMRKKIIVSSNESVLGIETNQKKEVCNIQIVEDTKGSTTISECNIDIQIKSIKYLNWDEYYSIQLEGTYPKYIYAHIKVYECKRFSLLDPLTWGKCKRVLIDTYEGDIKLRYFGRIYLDGIYQSSRNFSFLDSSFSVTNLFKKDISKGNVSLKLDIYSQVKGKEWIDISYVLEKDIQVPKFEKVEKSLPFSFPLDRYIGVTQWHGCTKYQCPHKGMDFGSRLNRVISIGDGSVIKVGYDKYGGECNQGGNYVIVKHTNGMYSTYFHLDSYSVKVGSKVKVGTLIGISGNTGKWNCQKLGYHLHFEIRKGLSSSTHVNPVKYIGIDWNLIPTLGYKQYPKRLSGENPHPNF